jgi:hypothetical protein
MRIHKRCVSAVSLAYVFVVGLVPSQPVSAQAFLGTYRQTCLQQVTILNAQSKSGQVEVEVQPFSAVPVPVADGVVKWRCGSVEMDPVRCPARTNLIMVDRSQGPQLFLILCLRR